MLSRLERPAEHSDSGAIGRTNIEKLPSAFRCRHMITVYDVQSLASDVIHFLFQAARAILRRGQLEAVA